MICNGQMNGRTDGRTDAWGNYMFPDPYGEDILERRTLIKFINGLSLAWSQWKCFGPGRRFIGFPHPASHK